MVKFIKGIATHAVCSGISIFLQLPKKVASMLDIVISSNSALAASLVIGGVIGWGFVLLWPILKDGEIPSFRRFLSLEDAARKSYEALENTSVGTLVERLNGDDPLGYYKHAFVINGVRLYAQKPPSSVHRKIPQDPNKIWNFIGNDLSAISDNKPTYTDCRVKSKDVKNFIKHYKSN